jgi:hypothetical protein
MFVDFSGKKGTPSFEMGNKAAMNDLQTTSSLIESTIYFLTSQSFLSTKPKKNVNNRSKKSMSLEDKKELLSYAESQ